MWRTRYVREATVDIVVEYREYAMAYWRKVLVVSCVILLLYSGRIYDVKMTENGEVRIGYEMNIMT